MRFCNWVVNHAAQARIRLPISPMEKSLPGSDNLHLRHAFHLLIEVPMNGNNRFGFFVWHRAGHDVRPCFRRGDRVNL
eukprot:6782778-Pyramimonas_sp.AAC.1